jgi:hypothetical protein
MTSPCNSKTIERPRSFRLAVLRRERQLGNASVGLRAIPVRDVRDGRRRLHGEAQDERVAARVRRCGSAGVGLERLGVEARRRRIEVVLERRDRMIAAGIAPQQIIGDVAGVDDDTVADEVPRPSVQWRFERELGFEDAAGTQAGRSKRVRLDRLQPQVQLVAVRCQVQARRVPGRGAADGERNLISCALVTAS